MGYKFYQLIEFRNCNGGCGNPDCNEERQTMLFYGIEPLCKSEALKIIHRESSLICHPEIELGVEILPDWKRFNILFQTLSGLKGIRKFKCEEVKSGCDANDDGIPPNKKIVGAENGK